MKNINLIPTSQPSRLWINNLLQGKLELSKESLPFNTSQNINITSNEKIKEGDWIFNEEKEPSVLQCIGQGSLRGWKKIILTTDKDLIKDGVQAIDDEFLEWFVKNPSCEEVEVTYEVLNPFQSIDKGYVLRLPDIANFLEEPKQEATLEEAGGIAAGLCQHLEEKEQAMFIAGFIECAKWQAKRRYSEEEVLQLIKARLMYFGILTTKTENINWFEQFKKK